MAHGPRYRVMFRRRREGKTDYRKRLGLLRANIPRAVVRFSNKNVIVQMIEYDSKGDEILVKAYSQELKKFGWNHQSTANTPAAYLTGYLAGSRALKKDIKKVNLDAGLNTITKGGKMFGALKGMIDAGLEIPHSDEILPSEERVMGKHINDSLPELVKKVKKSMEA